jgi:2-(1,2-epoxy-1,2-dihydrophenyl)acetyl-CoA isomerase
MSYPDVAGLTVALDGPTLRVTLDKPDRRNAIDDVMMRGLVDTFTVAATDEQVRVIVLAGAGEHFCGGADILARNTPNRASKDAPRPRAGAIQRRLPTQAHHLIPLVCEVQVPVVCRVQGFAAGIGFSLALAADFTIATADARLWEPFAQRGFTADSGATWLLPRRVGEVRARELLLLGRELSGADAAAWGAIHSAVPAGEIDDAVGELADRLASGPTVTLGLMKWMLHAGRDATLEQHLRNEGFAMELSSRSEDFREGLTAFREKRDPKFTGK